MSWPLFFAALAVVAAATSAALTRLWIVAAADWGFVDPPNPLVAAHRQATVSMGGTAVALAALSTGLGAFLLAGGIPTDDAPIGRVAAGALAFLLLGMIDDALRLSARWKLGAQIGIATWFVAAGGTCPFTGHAVLDACLSGLAIVTVVNAVNLTDVSDGLVAGLAAITLSTIAVMATPASAGIAIAACAAAGACAGFLVFNAPPARVFLGDAGSQSLGFLMAALLLVSPPSNPLMDRVIEMLLVLGVFLFELTLLVTARARRGLRIWEGSPDHVALRLQAAGVSKWWSAGVAWLTATALGLTATIWGDLPTRWRPVAALVILGITLALFACVWRMPVRPAQRGDDAEARRLLWIAPHFVTAAGADGTRPVHVVSALLEAGWTVDVVTTQRGTLDGEGRGQQPSCRVEREGRLTIHRLRTRGDARTPGRSPVSFCARAILSAGQFRHLDVVYASAPPLPPLLASMAVAVVRRAPMVLDLSGSWPLGPERLSRVRSSPSILMRRWLEGAAYRFTRHAIVGSSGFGSYLTGMGLESSRQTLAPMGGDAIRPERPGPDLPAVMTATQSARFVATVVDRVRRTHAGRSHAALAMRVLIGGMSDALVARAARAARRSPHADLQAAHTTTLRWPPGEPAPEDLRPLAIPEILAIDLEGDSKAEPRG